jgi:hypothetical protein
LITTDGDARVTLNGLPAGLVINVRDYIGWKWDAAGSPASTFDRRTMARAVLPAVANSGGVAVVTVEPPVNTALVPGGAIAHLDNPACVMQLVPEESELGPISAGALRSGGTIFGIQDLRP